MFVGWSRAESDEPEPRSIPYFLSSAVQTCKFSALPRSTLGRLCFRRKTVRFTHLLSIALLTSPFALAQQDPQPVALTIYNQNFAVARTSIDLDLHPGVNEVTTTHVTSRLEPDSVVLRDPAGTRIVHVLEQNYDAAIVNQDWLLQKYEGKTIDFQFSTPQGMQTVQGTIIRAPSQQQYESSPQGQITGGGPTQPLIEANGKMQFQLPGTPLFPAATDGLLLKPTLRWQIHSDKTEHFQAELAYITGGLNWEANYNVVVPDSAPDSSNATNSEKADFVGWVTIHNKSGTEFPQARIKLMAGDVDKIQPSASIMKARAFVSGQAFGSEPQVTQKPFDDFHLYDLNRTVALRDGETKQIQFLDAAEVTVHRNYLYDGAAQIQPWYNNNGINQDRNFGLDSGNTKVAIVQEIKNSKANHLGIPLPAGRIRLYRRDAGGQMEFTGEDTIDHTPAEDTLKLATGSAFDVKGSRRQTDFHVNVSGHILDESFEIKITNQKQQPVTVNVIEHLYRGANWEITDKSSAFSKNDSHTVQFPLQVPAKGDATLTYSVRYTW